MSIEAKRRELFEEAARRDWDKACHDFVRLADGYQNDHTDVAWWGFNAALDSVVIQMPNRFEYSSPDSAGAAIFDCASAIKSTGLGLKVRQ